jgi:hypothetical protein
VSKSRLSAVHGCEVKYLAPELLASVIQGTDQPVDRIHPPPSLVICVGVARF